MPNNQVRSSVSRPQFRRLKQAVKKYKKQHGVKHHVAQEVVARNAGFSNWKALKKASDKYARLLEPTPQISLKFASDEDVSLSGHEREMLKTERLGELPDDDKLLLAKNRAFLARNGIDYALFEPTKTGLKKSILDATQPVRVYLKSEDFHDYDLQGQGQGYKQLKAAKLLTATEMIKSRVSLYRPNTKQGDPRMWFTKLAEIAPAGSQVAIIIHEDMAHLINLTEVDLNDLTGSCSLTDFISEYNRDKQSVAAELLAKIRKIAKKPLRALDRGDTDIGMAVEAALGIEANSSKLPDYKGIELKAGRGSKTRSNLFAQVADWGQSSCKSSREILEKYGYDRDGAFKLYCTISTKRPNSQGLQFRFDEDEDLLIEFDDQKNDVAVWSGELLRTRLLEKHSETFWIQAETKIIDGLEYFHLKSVTHTMSPLISQFMPLIKSGVITMDHLIKRSGGSRPKVTEKGPLFKINKSDLPLLFPMPVKYTL